MSTSPQSIEATLAALKQANTGGRTSLGDVLDAFGQRTYGPIFFVIGAIALSPVGAIPGMSVICATIVILMALQMGIGAGAPWTPRAIRRLDVDSDMARRSIERVEPYLRRLDSVTRTRWQGLVDGPVNYLTVLALCVLALLMYPLALVPWGVMPVAFAIAILGLALLVRDGVLIVLGLSVSAISAGAGIYLLMA